MRTIDLDVVPRGARTDTGDQARRFRAINERTALYATVSEEALSHQESQHKVVMRAVRILVRHGDVDGAVAAIQEHTDSCRACPACKSIRLARHARRNLR